LLFLTILIGGSFRFVLLYELYDINTTNWPIVIAHTSIQLKPDVFYKTMITV